MNCPKRLSHTGIMLLDPSSQVSEPFRKIILRHIYTFSLNIGFKRCIDCLKRLRHIMLVSPVSITKHLIFTSEKDVIKSSLQTSVIQIKEDCMSFYSFKR